MPLFLAALTIVIACYVAYRRIRFSKLLNISSCKSLSTVGDRSFNMTAPKLWNDLPLSARNICSVNACKRALKTHLFQKAFSS